MTVETRPPETGPIQEVPETIEPAAVEPDVTRDPQEDNGEAKIPGFMTTADSLVVRLSDGQTEYEAVLTPAERDRIPVIIEDPRNSTLPFERFHIDSKATAYLATVEPEKKGDDPQRVWRDLPTRNVISPVVTKDGIKIAILGSEESDRS
jgi:hypothetical protein